MSTPNILLIVSDDHGYGDLSIRGTVKDVNTPNLDRLAESGLTCDQAYVSAPICSPSRAGLITGAYQQRWGAEWFHNSNCAPSSYPTIPEVLKPAGYHTGYFGKVHYGGDDAYGSRSCPDQHGFEESFYGLAEQGMGRLHYLYHGNKWVEKYGEAARVHGVHPMLENGQPVDCDNHLTVEFTDRAINFMSSINGSEDSEANPFFCMIAYNAVHNFTWQLPEYELNARGLPQHPDFDPDTSDYVDWYDGMVSPNLENGREYYLAQLEIMDREIGRLLDFLEETQLAENTLVIYLTDNGGSTCNYGNNSPLTGTKYTLYEGGIRVPFLAKWPNYIEAGTKSQALVSALDLLPTFADIAGVSLPDDSPIDGISLKNVFSGNDSTGHDALFFDTGFQWAVRTPDWKLRWTDGTSEQRKHLLKVEHTDIGEGLALTDMKADHPETPATNVVEDFPEVVERLRELRYEWCSKISSENTMS